MFKSLKILPILVVLLQACGGGKSTGESETITAPAINGSSYSGLAFGAVNRDRNIRTSRIYYYDFKAGEIVERFSGESGSPGLFYKDSKLFVFNRDSGNQNLKVVGNIKEETIVPALDLEGLLPGDPASIETILPGNTLMLGAQESEKIFRLDYKTGDLTEIDTSNLKTGKIRPSGMQRTGSVINVINSGVKKIAADSYSADGNQAIYQVEVESDGTTKFIDKNDSTPGVMDGEALTATNPVIAGVEGTTLSVIGLCSDIISGCISAIENYTAGSVILINDFASNQSFQYQLVNQIIAGPQANQVFAHVSTPAGEYKIILLNTSTLAATEVHTFSDYNLYGINYDRSSNTLLVGESGELSGTLYVYQDLVLKERVELSGVLSSSAFIP